MLAASLALSTFLPANLVAAEETAPAEENVTADKTNESILNYLEGEDYIFAAERIPTNRWDTPANVHVITAEEIENNHYQSVGEALSHVNGVLIPDNMGMDDGGQIRLNGFSRVLLLVDGRRMINDES